MNVRALLAGFKQGLRSTAKDGSDVFGRSLFLGLVLIVMSALWRTATSAHGGAIGGYDYRALGWYVFGAQVAVNLIPSRIIETIGDDIGGGAITVAMLRPVSVLGMRFALDAGAIAARLTVSLPFGAAVTWILYGPPPSAAALCVAVVAVALAGLLNLAAQHLFGAIAFWFGDAKSAWFLYQKIVFLPGGMLIPLELFPRALAAACRWLPFAGMAYIPGRIASGDVNLAYLAEQLGWLVLMVLAAATAYEMGQRRLETVGG